MPLFAALRVLSVLAFVYLTTASPIADAAFIERSVATAQFTVQITDPVFGDFWEIGFENPVKWTTSTIPTQAENDTVSILLGYYDNDNVEHVNSSKLHSSPSRPTLYFPYECCCSVLNLTQVPPLQVAFSWVAGIKSSQHRM